MNVLILNGNPDVENRDFDKYLNRLKNEFDNDKDKINIIYIRDQNVIHCTGCWSCWVKTPGKCKIKDDTYAIREAYIKSDMVIFASPITMGFISSGLKKVMDKLIPLLHPYTEIVRKEVHHKKRYAKYPLIGLLYENMSRDPEDIKITTDIFVRFALNFRSVLIFSFSISTDMLDVIDEIDSY